MPSRPAAAAPSTATGSRAVAAFRKRPWATVVPTVRGQVQAGGLHGQGVGVDRRDQRAAVGVDVADGAGVVHGGDRADAGDHAGCGERELGGVAAEGLPVGDGEQVGAQLVDLGQQPGLGGGGEAEHGDDRGDADRDAERGQRGAQLAGAHAHGGESGQIRRRGIRCGGAAWWSVVMGVLLR